MPSATYEWLYRIIRLLRIPIGWVFGTHPELAELVESGRIEPGRAVDLGCGTGREAIYLAGKGFEVTGVDISPTAIRMAKQDAVSQGVDVDFVVDDLTDLQHLEGEFDFLLDFGALNDLDAQQRDAYMENLRELGAADSQMLLMCFDNKLPSEEIQQRFQQTHEIEPLPSKRETGGRRALSFYLLRRK